MIIVHLMWKPILAAILAVFLVLIGSIYALSHSWYPHECCSEKDCAVVAPERVKVVPLGYLIDNFHMKLHRDIRHSPDGLYHGCFPTPQNLICFFAPPQSM